jgi:hypothetical protein
VSAEPSERSGLLLAAGLRALQHGDRERAARFLDALYREGHDAHYRELYGAFQEQAAL